MPPIASSAHTQHNVSVAVQWFGVMPCQYLQSVTLGLLAVVLLHRTRKAFPEHARQARSEPHLATGSVVDCFSRWQGCRWVGRLLGHLAWHFAQVAKGVVALPRPSQPGDHDSRLWRFPGHWHVWARQLFDLTLIGILAISGALGDADADGPVESRCVSVRWGGGEIVHFRAHATREIQLAVYL